MTSLSLFDLAVLFLPVLLLVLLWGVVRVFLPPRLPRVAEGACARCRYPVRGLGDWKCPECGTDLRVGGILTPALRHRARASLAGGIVSWTLLMIVVGLGTAAVAVPRMVTPVRMQAGVTTSTVDLYSRSGQYPLLQIEITRTDPGDGSALSLTRSLNIGRGDPLSLDRGSDLTESQVLEWLSGLGVDTGAARVRAEATDAARIVNTLGSNGAVSSSVFTAIASSSMTRATGPVRYRYDINPWLWVTLGAWIVLLIGGLWGMIAVRRRQRTRAGRAKFDAATVVAAPPKDAPAATDELP